MKDEETLKMESKMEADRIMESAPLAAEEFEMQITSHALALHHIGQFFKSPSRAIKRGNASIYGDIYPKRPFNNKKNTCKRKGKYSSRYNFDRFCIYTNMKKITSLHNNMDGE